MTGTQKPGQVRSVNSQITDAISQTNTLALGLAPAQSIGTLYQTTAQAVGASIQNAVANQQNLQSLNMAALTQNLQAILRNTLANQHLSPAHMKHLTSGHINPASKNTHLHQAVAGTGNSLSTAHK
ncbi:MAG: RebB family R body protein [Proteobacteria bacterium]|nr:RebB family R body protein [Pseudomonadota bacterium]